MSATIWLEHDYGGGTTADRLFEVATDWDCLRESVKGLIEYRDLPDAPIRQDQVIRTAFSLFGLLPWQDWTMEVREFDEEKRRVVSHEFGGAVKAWDHTLTVAPTDDGARLVDLIFIEAGALTPVYAAWGRFMYGRRHRPRMRMLGLE